MLECDPMYPYYNAVAVQALSLMQDGESRPDAVDIAFGLVPDGPNDDEPTYAERQRVFTLMRRAV